MRLIAVGGLPGTGKSVVSARIATHLDALLLRTDVVRKELFPHPQYTDAENNQVYTEVYRQAAEALDGGQVVILDATFRQQADRSRAAELAAAHGVPFALILVTAPEEQVRQRLAQRHSDASDADWSIYVQMKAQFEPVHQQHSQIDNRGTLTDLDRQIEEWLARER